MYFSVFSSSEYYSDEDVDNKLIIDKDQLCLICWLPTEETNKIKLLSEFSHINPKCKCKPKLHTLCINEWIKKTPSCPICRTQMNIIVFNSDNKNLFINCYIKCCMYSVKLLRFGCYASFINLLFLLLYNIYSIYFMTNQYNQDDYGIY
jgi:hypothetical protein